MSLNKNKIINSLMVFCENFALIGALLYALVVFPRAVWDCMECCVHINEPGRNSGPNRHHPAGYKAGLELLHPNRRY